MLLTEPDTPWGLADVEAAIFSDRTILADLLRQPLVDACTATPTVDLGGATVDLADACAVLDAWDGSYTLDAPGAILFREWLSRFAWTDMTDAGRLFSDAFDPADPAGTPSVPVDDRADVAGRARQRGAAAVGWRASRSTRPLRDWQFEIRSGDRIPIHGGTWMDGVANIVDCCAEHDDARARSPTPATPVNDTTSLYSLPDGGIGYPISRGASFVMALQFGPDGPEAEAFLTYGNPDDPADPAYRAGLEAFWAGAWTAAGVHAGGGGGDGGGAGDGDRLSRASRIAPPAPTGARMLGRPDPLRRIDAAVAGEHVRHHAADRDQR